MKHVFCVQIDRVSGDSFSEVYESEEMAIKAAARYVSHLSQSERKNTRVWVGEYVLPGEPDQSALDVWNSFDGLCFPDPVKTVDVL